ncbi:MAG: ABC transporter permease subunit [Bacillota bacterium]
MIAEFKHTLRRLHGQIIGWSVGVALYGLWMVLLYPSVSKLGEDLDVLLNAFPKEMLAFFQNIRAIGTPMGYIDVYFFTYMHLVIGIFAISAGAGLLAADEEKGILDLVLAHPVSRTGLFLGRLLGLICGLAIILLAGWLSWVLPAGSVGLGLGWLQLLLPFIPLFAVLLLFAAAALFLSMVTPAARVAGMLTGAILVGNFLMLGLSNINEKLEPIMRFTPLHYYQGGAAVEGLNGEWLAGLLAASLLFAAGAWRFFLRRDIRVAGERGWRVPGVRLPSRSGRRKRD